MSADEVIQLVNKDDMIIGQKTRNQLTNHDCWRIISVWITSNDRKILLQQRSAAKQVLPNAWTAAAEGTVDYGDDYLITAKRETEEEIGLSGVSLTPSKKYYGPWGNFGHRQCQGYLATFNGSIEELTIQESEVQAIRWFTSKEIQQLYSDEPKLFPLYKQYQQLGFINF